jgi:hypothetical protein
MKTYVDAVKLLETPSPRSPFYVVEGSRGVHYVSATGGKAATGLREGTIMKMYKVENTLYSHYVLER